MAIMSQHGIRMTFCDIELELLQKAIAHYLDVCKRELKNGSRAPFIAHSSILKSIRADLAKASKGRLELPLGELERPTLQLALKSYVEEIEQESATHVNKLFRADKELAKVLLEAISVELWRAVWTGELRDHRRGWVGGVHLSPVPNIMYIIPIGGRIFGFGVTRKEASLDFASRRINYDGPKPKIYRCSPELYRQLMSEGGTPTPSALRFRFNAKGVAVPDAS
jgi:hypothetical protein